ncbi:hypothetical protein MIND_01427900 [Mycena indigotica]|uniref:F-box domain-containing protein n=1 Tax=Mycena indigotica TaxID=2126181 RepID=A0A8H6RXB5_9AGAR|nr:uncharacterized protein MIND_01427900 [Mycena indigotica]KAF7288613.1 hypothetical protein MIND_01427900 [Mycena indigotica]
MSLSSFPHELIAHIVSYLQDVSSLRTAALLHPTFRPWVRDALFHTVRLTHTNVFAFRELVQSSPAVLPYIRKLDMMPVGGRNTSFVTLDPGTLLKCEAVAALKTYSDPFGFRHLGSAEWKTLQGAVKGLKKLELLVDRLYPLSYWATLLDSCESLESIDITVDSGVNGWTTEDVEVEIPGRATDAGWSMSLQSLCVSGEVKVLTPLSRWLLPRKALDRLVTLELDVYYLHDDYGPPEEDRRSSLVSAAMGSVRELTLHLDPPVPLNSSSNIHLTVASFPNLTKLLLRDGPDAELVDSLAWTASFLALPLDQQHSNLAQITLDHGIRRRDLLAVPNETWARLEETLLSASDFPAFPALASFTFANPHKFSFAHPDSIPAPDKRFVEEYVRGRLPRLAQAERGRVKLEFGGDADALRRRMWERRMVN